MRLGVIIAVASAVLVTPALAKGWPALPKDGFVSGRASTPEDIKAGRAICTFHDVYMDGGGEPPPGRALPNFPVPQYGYVVDDMFAENPNREPVIIIQAELWGEDDGLGLGVRHFDGRLECLETFYVEPLGNDPAKLPKLK